LASRIETAVVRAGSSEIQLGIEHFDLPRPSTLSQSPLGEIDCLRGVTEKALENDEPPTQGLRSGDKTLGAVAGYIVEELVAGFTDYWRTTEKGKKQLANRPDQYFLSQFGLPGPRKNIKHCLMAELYDRLQEALHELRQELPPSAGNKRRRTRQKATPNGD
jgi:hypothetical protein